MILANDFRRQWEDIGPDVMKAVSRAGESGWYILGNEVREFEAALGGLWGTSHAVGVASGLDAIEISLRVLGLKPGDRVITTPISAFATTLAIVRLGGVPVFLDCDEQGLIRLDLVERWLESNPDVRFFVPVHLYGFPLDLDHLERLRNRFDLKIVEDCAQSVLADWCGRPAGTAGQIAATSFYPTKNLGAMGDGGAVLTSNPQWAAEVASYRDYGQSAKYQHTRIGYNSRLDEVHAAILRSASLPRLRRWTERRKQIGREYLEGITNPRIRMPRPRPGQGSCFHLFPVFVEPALKAGFIAYLRAAGIAAGEHYPLCIFEQQALAGTRYEVMDGCRNALELCRSEVSLPIHPYMDEFESTAVIATCNQWV